MTSLLVRITLLINLISPSVGISQDANGSVDPFYKKIEETKTLAQQKEILEKRIRLGVERGVGLNTQNDFQFYFKLDLPFEKKRAFIESVIDKNKNDKEALMRFSKVCQKIQCVIILTENLSKKRISNFPFLLKNALAGLEPEQLQFLIKNQEKVAESLKKMVHLAQDEQVKRDLIFNTRFLGFYQIGIDFLEANTKMIEASIWTQLDYCVLKYLAGKNKESKECLLKHKAKDPEFLKHLMYLNANILKESKPKYEEFAKIKKKINSFNDDSLNNQMLLFEMLIFKNLDNVELTKYNPETIYTNYFLGFTFLKILEALEKKPSKWHRDLKKNYSENFSGQFLLQVLNGKDSGQSIVWHFGKNAPISQALLLKND